MATVKDTDTGVEESGSTVVFDNICQPCENDGKVLEAEGRCEDCDEYLCNPCFMYHTLPSKMRHHVMIGKDQLNKDGAQGRKDRCTQWCPQHDDEVIKYFCPTHSFLGCSACMILNHKSCSGTVYIPEVAKDLLSSEEYRNYKASTSAMETRSQEITTDATERIHSFSICQPAAVEKFKCFQKEIIDLLEITEQKLIKESEKEKEEEIKKQESILDKTVVVEKELRALISPVESFESKKQFCNMYTALMKTKDGIIACEKRLGELDQGSEPHREIHFVPNRSIISEMLSSRGIGKIKDGITQVKHERDVNVKTDSDTKICWISSSVMLPNSKLIITDCENDKLKMVDTRLNKVVEEFSFQSHPWDVTATSSNEVAVTLFGRKIAFVKTDGQLMNHRNIRVKGECRGIACRENTLVVTYKNPLKVEVVDMKGLVLSNIAFDDKMEVKLNALFVVVHSKNKSIYISDDTGGKVVCLTSDGTLTSTYTDTRLVRPMGMDCDSFGTVYVCDWKNHTIHQITHGCKKKKIMLTEKDVTKPYTISYCEDESKFYIGMRDNDIVKVFKAM